MKRHHRSPLKPVPRRSAFTQSIHDCSSRCCVQVPVCRENVSRCRNTPDSYDVSPADQNILYSLLHEGAEDDIHHPVILRTLDQIDGIIHFEAREPLPAWDRQIESLCYQANGILDKISQLAPEWTTSALDSHMVS